MGRHLWLTAAHSPFQVVPYDLLLKELDITNVRELEDMIIDCVYQGNSSARGSSCVDSAHAHVVLRCAASSAGLIKGKLDQKKSAFEVTSTIGRDIGPSDVPDMLKKLTAW